MMGGGILAIVTGRLLRVLGAKSNRTRSRAHRSIEHRHRTNGNDDSCRAGVSIHAFHRLPQFAVRNGQRNFQGVR